MRYLIRNGEVIDGTGRRAFASDVLIEDGRIAEIAPSIAARDAEIIDASGRVVTPGFIDIHCHGRSGVDFSDATDAAITTIATE